MKKLFLVVSFLMVLVLAPMAMADQLTWSRQDGYYSGTGGEFTLAGDNIVPFQPYYVDSTKNQVVAKSIQSFCVEKDEYVSSNPNYFYVNDKAVQGGINTNAGDPLSKGAAWLYHQFQLGILDGYNYTPGSARITSAGLLQDAIWYLEEETGNPGTNVFINAVSAKFGSFALAQADNNGQYAVAVLNLYNLDGSYAQDMLVCVPEPATMFLLGSGLIGVAGFARKRFGKKD
jgi:hypothetical protein